MSFKISYKHQKFCSQKEGFQARIWQLKCQPPPPVQSRPPWATWPNRSALYSKRGFDNPPPPPKKNKKQAATQCHRSFLSPPRCFFMTRRQLGVSEGLKSKVGRGGGESWRGGYRTRGSWEARSGRPFSLHGGVPASVGETEHPGQERE